MLVEIGVGDAYGCGFELAPQDFVEHNNDLDGYVNHPRRLQRSPESYQPSLVPSGRYTDDTQMSLAVAEAMLDVDEPWTRESLADRFLACFKRDERRGYTTYFLNVLLNSRTGGQLLSKINGKSTKSGAAMRAAPLGLLPNLDQVIEKAATQAAVTHDTFLGRNSAAGVAMMAHYFYYQLGPRARMSEWLREEMFGDTLHNQKSFVADGVEVWCWSPDLGRRVRVDAWDCLEAAVYAIEAHDNMADILRQCVAYGGDVDTVAAIAMGVASCAQDVEQNLPQVLIDDLENRAYGRDYLARLDQELFKKFPRPVKSTSPVTHTP